MTIANSISIKCGKVSFYEQITIDITLRCCFFAFEAHNHQRKGISNHFRDDLNCEIWIATFSFGPTQMLSDQIKIKTISKTTQINEKLLPDIYCTQQMLHLELPRINQKSNVRHIKIHRNHI